MIITTIARHTAVRWMSWSTVTRKVTHQVSQCRRRPASSLAQSISMLKFNTRAISTSSYLNADAKEGDGFRIISPTASKDAPVKKGTPTINVTFILQSGERLTAKGREGDTLLDVVVDNELDIDGYGACEGTLACSTCHLILKQADFDALPNGPTDEEMDMLDLAYDLTETSRLGCQIYLTKEMDGLEVEVPASVNDVRLT